ncbi:type IV pilus biogenesis protein PilM [Bacillus timonensis]|uniref:type IV pilus biogenesis protein PilM n=1 Tax=Bacillus timonensis TaxID=1033734 RepID=UPI000289C569|nr:pilus assembly protein PilM [Bacillus timonensis]
MSLFRKKSHRVSMMIRNHTIRYVETIKPNVIINYGERRLPYGVIEEGNIIERETLLTILEECVENWKIKGAKLQFCVPDPYMLIRNTTVPFDIPDDEVQGHLYLELGETLHLPFEDPILETNVIGEKDGEKQIILIASPEHIISNYVELLEEAKVKPEVADITPLAMYRLFYSQHSTSQAEHYLMIQVNLDSVDMTVFHQDIPIFTRHLPLSMESKQWDVKMGRSGIEEWVYIGDEKDLIGKIQDIVLEVERIINFYHFSLHKGNESVTQIRIGGDHPFVGLLMERAKQSINIPIQKIVDTPYHTKAGEDIPERFFDCIGLSLHGYLT